MLYFTLNLDYNVVADLNGDGTLKDSYIRGINLIESTLNGYYLYDAHGDVVQLSNNNGDVVRNYSYDAFGVEEDLDEEDVNPFRYCGEYFDKETGSIYLRARYYNPMTGRFMTKDSYKGKLIDVLSLNLYTYCHSNPIRFRDPTGHWVEGDEKYPAHIQTYIRAKTEERLKAQKAGNQKAMDKAHSDAEYARFLGNKSIEREQRRAKDFSEKWVEDKVKTEIVVHHENSFKYIRYIEKDHIKRGFDGVGYHFVIDVDGTVYEGRPLNYKGEHVANANTGKIGISLAGRFTDDILGGHPTEEQFESLENLN